MLHVPDLVLQALQFSNTLCRGSEKVVKHENFLETLLDFNWGSSVAVGFWHFARANHGYTEHFWWKVAQEWVFRDAHQSSHKPLPWPMTGFPAYLGQGSHLVQGHPHLHASSFIPILPTVSQKSAKIQFYILNWPRDLGQGHGHVHPFKGLVSYYLLVKIS